MKTTTKLLSGTLALAIVAISVATTKSTFAFRGENSSRQSIEHSPLVILETLPLSELSESEKELLIYGQQEERLAHDVYAVLYAEYGLQIFDNISQSEDKHTHSVGALLERYGIPQTTGYGELQETYDTLIEKGMLSLQDAIEVGIMIEVLDISDLDKSLALDINEDIRMVYENLRKGSINHLNAFVRTLQKNGFETDLDWHQFTSQERVDSRGNGQKGKGDNPQGKRGEHGEKGQGKRSAQNSEYSSVIDHGHSSRSERGNRGGQGGRSSR